MKKRIIASVLLSLITMFLLPLVSLKFIGGNDALGILLIYLLAVGPIVSVVIGVLSGFSNKILWYLPVINAAIFLISLVVIVGFAVEYIIFALIYLALGIIATFITKAIKVKKAK